MKIASKSFFERFPLRFFAVILALSFMGLLNIYSSTQSPLNPEAIQRLFSQQILWFLLGMTVFFLATFIHYDILKKLGYFLYVLNLGVLLGVLFYGKSFYGATRWLDLKFFKYQPSETMKLALIFVLAHLLSRKKKNLKDGLGLWEIGKLSPIILIPFFLVFKQPDLGTGLLFILIAGSMMIFVKIQKKVLISGAITLALALPLAWQFVLKDYQKDRIRGFLTPHKHSQSLGYNAIQSKIAVGSGRWAGKGFQKGTQSQLRFLPERHSDFIFSVLSEEYGFLGSAFTLALIIALLSFCLRIAQEARDQFGMLLTVGVTSMIFWQAFINIAMVIGILPVVGIPLPLLSYGGSNLVTTMAALGIVSSVHFKKDLF